jgi:hypothetical protein
MSSTHPFSHPSECQVLYIGKPNRHPFIISPNLDALLEHDERTRPRILPDAAPAPSGMGTFIGLPPPPRGPRKTTSTKAPAATATATADADNQIVGRPDPSINVQNTTGGVKPSPSGDALPAVPLSSGPNPFINPAPSLESVLEAKAAMLGPLLIDPASTDVLSLPRDDSPVSARAVVNGRQTNPMSPSSSTEVVKKRSQRVKSQRHQAGLPHHKALDHPAHPPNRRTPSNAQSAESGCRPSGKTSTAIRPRNRPMINSQLGKRLQIQRLV